ncbi:alpha/beta hydrolase [Alkalispirochaeta americana]|nr:alpha/beta hydrolase [Alkalispirochaeta americana]
MRVCDHRSELARKLNPYDKAVYTELQQKKHQGLSATVPEDPHWKRYRRSCALPQRGLAYSFSWNFCDTSLAVHLFESPGKGEIRGTLFLLHGYLNHTGSGAELIRFLAGEGYRVFSLDLPGHGLSQGPLHDIDDFSRYSDLFVQFSLWLKRNWPAPYFFIGHSTGCSGFIDACLASGNAGMVSGQPSWHIFRRYILLAPLVRSAQWDLSYLGFDLLGGFVETCMGGKVPNLLGSPPTRDRTIKERHKKDPLRGKETSLSWVEALRSWDSRNRSYPAKDNLSPLVFQGTGDSVVDWKYNLKFLKEKLPEVRIKTYPGALHGLHYEARSIRKQLFADIRDELTGL